MIDSPEQIPANNNRRKTCILIPGPTAVGKTAIAIQLAQYFSTQIISCDSRQCFKELNIGVAKPSDAELETVHHYFINSHSIHETVNAAVFEKYALEKVNEIFKKHDIAVIVGGTGLYAKAFCDGIDEVPQVDATIRKELNYSYEQYGIEWLQQEVKTKDPLYYNKGEVLNPQRLLRALEVKLSFGKSIVEYQTNIKKKRDFNIIKIGLELPRHELYERINRRVDIMLEHGLLNEVTMLLPFEHLNALQTVGYKELFAYLKKEILFEEAIDEIKKNTRHYAKRQMTWFKKDTSIKWCKPAFDEVLSLVKASLAGN